MTTCENLEPFVAAITPSSMKRIVLPFAANRKHVVRALRSKGDLLTVCRIAITSYSRNLILHLVGR